MIRKSDRISRGYGAEHRRLRKLWAARIREMTVTCARCGQLIWPEDDWDLGHDDLDRSVYTGPEHARCNRATATHAMHRRRRRGSRPW